MSIFSVDSLVDNIDKIVCIYSFQQRISSYTGPCMQIRRSSDNSTQNFYFTSNGNLDYNNLLSWIGNSNASLVIWYDQTVKDNLSMTTDTGRQPRITTSPGVLSLTSNGILKPLWLNNSYLIANNQKTNNKHVFVKSSFTPGSYTFLLSSTNSSSDFHNGVEQSPQLLFDTTTNNWGSTEVSNATIYINGIETNKNSIPYSSPLRLVELILTGTSTQWNNLGNERNYDNRLANGSTWVEVIIFNTTLTANNRFLLESYLINEISTISYSIIPTLNIVIGPNINLSGVNLSGVNLTNAITGPLAAFPSTLPSISYKNITTNSGKYIIGPYINLSNFDLSGVDLSGVDLSDVNLTNTKTGPLINFPLILPNNNYKNITDTIISDLTTITFNEGSNVNFTQIGINKNITSAYYYDSNYNSNSSSNVTLIVKNKYEEWLNNNNITFIANNATLSDTLYGRQKILYINFTNIFKNKYIIGPYLNLQSIDLSGIDISNTVLSNSNLQSSKLSNANFSGCNLSGCNLSGCDLSGVNLTACNLNGVNLTNTKTGPLAAFPTTLPSTSYKNITTNSGKYIIGHYINLSNFDLSGVDLSNSNLSNSNLSYANLFGANINQTNFSFADLSGTDLSNVNLIGSNLTNIYNKPIHIDSNWIFDPIKKSITPVLSQSFNNIIKTQLESIGSNNTIIIYQNSDTFINKTAQVITPDIDGPLYYSNTTNDIKIKINDISASDISNIIISIVNPSETTFTLPKINNIDPLFLLYFKVLDVSQNSVVSPIKPIIMDISVNTNSNFVALYKYINSSFDQNNYVLGSKQTSDLSTNIYKFNFTSNSDYIAVPLNSITVLTGGDPHIRPILGPQYILPNDIKYVCLLDDQMINLVINAHVRMMTKSDFVNPIFARDSWCDSRKLNYLYNYSYYREIYISIEGESIYINPDTLEVRSSNLTNKIRYIITKPKKGIYSLIHKMIYPIFETTRVLKVFVDKYIITIMSDITTDERHYINLEYYGTNNITGCNGAFISQTKTFIMDDIEGTNMDYYYKDFKAYIESLRQSL